MKPTIQQLDKDVSQYLVTTMKDQFGKLTILKDQTQHYYNVKGTCENTNQNFIISIRTEVFIDKDIDSSYLAITVFVESENINTRCDFSVRNMKEAVMILNGFINMSVLFHR